MHIRRRETCRACGSRALTEVINLGHQHLQGSFFKKGVPAPQRVLPMVLARCNPLESERSCGLLQARFTVPPEMMYRTYWYRSGVNSTMREHLKDVAMKATTFANDAVRPKGVTAPVHSSFRVLDIGCNDGTLLNFYPPDFDRWGVDPSNITAEVEGPLHIVNDFFPSFAADAAFRGDATTAQSFDIITAVAMFYDLEAPGDFASAVSSWLAPDGVFVFEMSYMPAMLRQNSYDTICHEHLEYYSLASIEHIMGSVGLRVVHVEENDINGGSLRCYAVHDRAGRRPDASVLDMRATEFDLQLDTGIPYENFQKRAEIHKGDLLLLLRKLKSEHKTVHIYGASTKGNTILQWCGIDRRLVDMAADRNPDKWGAVTPGTEIPIVSEEDSRALKPDYYLVLPWHFKKEFLARETTARLAGTRFIFPLPQIEIVGG